MDERDFDTAYASLPDPARLIQTAAWGEVPANQVCIMLADGKTRVDAENIARALGGAVVGELEFLNTFQIETNGSTEEDLRAALDAAAAHEGVELAFPNQQVFLQ